MSTYKIQRLYFRDASARRTLKTGMIQYSKFETGGFVLHKITLPGYESRFSAWFDQAGVLLDAERIDWKGVSRYAHQHARNELQTVGLRYAPREVQS